MTEKCRSCNEEIRKVGGVWSHVSIAAQIGKYQIHKPQPLVTMVDNDGEYFKNTDPRNDR